jgi:hypothetical protein
MKEKKFVKRVFVCVLASICQQEKKNNNVALRRLQIIPDCWKNRKAVRIIKPKLVITRINFTQSFLDLHKPFGKIL